MAITEKKNLIEELTLLRRQLHRNPSLSGNEGETAEIITSFLKETRPFSILKQIGGTGVAAVYKGTGPGPVVMVRAELDALPIQDISQNEYRSEKKGISHKCGHDGHMAIVAGLGKMIGENGLGKGTVILLFQPEEETGTGAQKVLKDEQFKALKPDLVFALHNLPGFPRHQVVVHEGTFTAASVGMIVGLKGKTAHAAEPENGRSPAMAISELIDALHHLPKKIETRDFALVTVVHAELGKKAFGVTPGKGTVMATLRSYDNKDFKTLKEEATAVAKEIAQKYELEYSISFEEHFDATENDSACVKIIRAAAEDLQLETVDRGEPFRWSEDFGCFTHAYKGAMFGLGAGDIADLHNPDYDFPDELISTGVRMFYDIVQKAMQS